MNYGHDRQLIKTRTVSASFVDTLLVTAEQLGVSKKTLAQAGGLQTELLQDPTNRVDECVMLSLFEYAVRLTENHNFGLIMGQNSRPGTYSALGYAVMNCTNLFEAFLLIPRYEDVVMEMGRTRIEKDNTQVKLIWGSQDERPCVRSLIDSIFSSWIFLAQWLTGKPIVPDKTLLSYSKPKDTRLHHKLLGRDIQFSATENAFFFFNGTALYERILQADQAMNQLMKQRVAELHTQLKNNQTLTQSVTTIATQKMPLGLITLGDIATELNQSERTLRRRLSEEGSNYHELLANLRHKLACNYLADPNLSVLDIALLLGYSEHSSFTAAFKNWQGETPIGYRKLRVR